jgi:hypothetical protein
LTHVVFDRCQGIVQFSGLGRRVKLHEAGGRNPTSITIIGS